MPVMIVVDRCVECGDEVSRDVLQNGLCSGCFKEMRALVEIVDAVAEAVDVRLHLKDTVEKTDFSLEREG